MEAETGQRNIWVQQNNVLRTRERVLRKRRACAVPEDYIMMSGGSSRIKQHQEPDVHSSANFSQEHVHNSAEQEHVDIYHKPLKPPKPT